MSLDIYEERDELFRAGMEKGVRIATLEAQVVELQGLLHEEEKHNLFNAELAVQRQIEIEKLQAKLAEAERLRMQLLSENQSYQEMVRQRDTLAEALRKVTALGQTIRDGLFRTVRLVEQGGGDFSDERHDIAKWDALVKEQALAAIPAAAPTNHVPLQEHRVICEQHGESCGEADKIFDLSMRYEQEHPYWEAEDLKKVQPATEGGDSK